jgi:hypothetical protein
MQWDLISQRRCGYPAAPDQTMGATRAMIWNGLYHIAMEMLDGL